MKSKKLCHLVAFACVNVMLFSVVSCEKMNVEKAGETDGNQSANVVLRVGSIEQVPFASTRAAVLSEACKRLSFLVYQDGARIRQENQTMSDGDFGEARFFIPEGRYFLVILAHSSDGNPTSTNAQKIGFTNKTGFTDTFLYADSLIVEDKEVEKTLDLKRIVAMVRFIPIDAVPEKADSIRFYYTGGSGTLDAMNDGWGSVNSTQTQWFSLSHTEKKFEIYTIPHDDSDLLTVTASTYQNGANLVSERKVEDIPVKRNHITTCRGYLFSPVYKMDFKITIDDEWDTDTIQFNF